MTMTTETDSELLELAAKAVGAEWTDYSDRTPDHWMVRHADGVWREWSPLADDGDALRLAVALEIEVRGFNGKAHAGKQDRFWCTENWFPDGDRYAATRRAIVRAAAHIIAKATP